jgi:hypothetical protein
VRAAKTAYNPLEAERSLPPTKRFEWAAPLKRFLEVMRMIVPFGQSGEQLQLARAVHELESCNPMIAKYGLALSAQEIQALVAGRIEALRETERIEFGRGIAKELVLGFASSPHVSQTNFAEILGELQELFYEFKNESLEQVPDDELIAKMRSLFDDVANGDIEYLAEALFDGLGRAVREAAATGTTETDLPSAQVKPFDDAADPEADRAVANGYTLAAHRYDVSKWVDETYAPPWDGASWLDE